MRIIICALLGAVLFAAITSYSIDLESQGYQGHGLSPGMLLFALVERPTLSLFPRIIGDIDHTGKFDTILRRMMLVNPVIGALVGGMVGLALGHTRRISSVPG